jgi:hypothetical protein
LPRCTSGKRAFFGKSIMKYDPTCLNCNSTPYYRVERHDINIHFRVLFTISCCKFTVNFITQSWNFKTLQTRSFPPRIWEARDQPQPGSLPDDRRRDPGNEVAYTAQHPGKFWGPGPTLTWRPLWFNLLTLSLGGLGASLRKNFEIRGPRNGQILHSVKSCMSFCQILQV